MVFIRTGKKAPIEMRKTAGGLPRPNHRMANGMKAMGGIGRENLDQRIYQGEDLPAAAHDQT